MDASPALPEKLSPRAWGDRLSGPPLLASDADGWRTGVVRRWRGTHPVMSQPPLDHHYVVLHLGGPKVVERRGPEGASRYDVADQSLTIVPAGASFEWSTTGPIDFAHLYVHPARLDRAVARAFDREPSAVRLDCVVGAYDPLLASLILAMLQEVEQPSPWRAPYLDALLETAMVQLARRHSSIAAVGRTARHALAPSRLRRVLEHVDAHLDGPISLDMLAGVAGLSRFHFSRAFRNAVGEPPLAYVARRRVEAARALLARTDLSLADVARRTGFGSASWFSTAFRRHTGLQPSAYRDAV
jgi:AraC family transcriptional regulator